MLVTETQLKAILGNYPNIGIYCAPLNLAAEHYEINTRLRMSAFISQVAVESAYFNAVVEDLDYSEQALLRVFPSHFTPEEAARYARQPEMIANRVYANRYGNGDEASGDGWRYRGRGLIQLTFKDNYESFSSDLQIALDDSVEYALSPGGAAMTAGWFWKTRNINAAADSSDFDEVTRLVTGGNTDYGQRYDIYVKCLRILG